MPRTSSRPLRWERRPDARPQELLEAALRIFATRGYHNTRLEDVAAEVGVTKGTIYHYFDNKEQLLLRAVDQYQERAFGRIHEAIRARDTTAAERIGLLIRGAFGGVDPERSSILLLLLQGIAHEVPDVYRRWLATGPLEAWRLLTSIIGEGIAQGEFRADADAEVCARIVLSGLLTQLVWQRHAPRVDGIGIAPERLVESSIAFLLASLEPVGGSHVRSSRHRATAGGAA
jgi:AcrR family transcriptional regulator